jgi:Flp pilus assembly protein TadD
MYRTANSHRVFGLAVTTAMAGALLSGCATTAAPHGLAASRSAPVSARAQNQAIAQAEAAVQATPNDAANRVALGNAYLKAGRFASAATTFNDAMTLGDTSPRTALTLALALLGEGKQAEAGAVLNRWEDKIPAADAGLALALSGQADRGVYLMSQAIRGGQNDVKIRQNLAYAYALAGRWREARLMASQDVPADQVGARMEQWAQSAHPDAWQTRVAGLLDVPAGVNDAGQPVRLALANNTSVQQLAAEAAPVAQPAGELPALASATPSAPVAAVEAPVQVAQATPAPAEPVAAAAPAPVTFASAFVAPAVNSSAIAAVAPQDAAQFAEAPVIRAPQAYKRAATPVSNTAVRSSGESTHLIQLGSFASEAGARRAWQIYNNKYPELAGHQLVISEAVVRGKHYWRVSAGQFGRASSSSMCSRVRGAGEGCFAYAEGRPLPGAIDRGIRLASR